MARRRPPRSSGISRRRPASPSTPPGNYFIDYGRTWVGGLSPRPRRHGRADGGPPLRRGHLRHPNTVKYQTSAGNTYQDKWILKAGRQHLETWGLRVFRYVQVLDAPPGLTAADFSAEAYVYPFDESAGAVRLLRLAPQPGLAAVARTRSRRSTRTSTSTRGSASAAPTRPTPTCSCWATSTPAATRRSATTRCSYLMSNRTWPTEWPMYIILAVHDSYEADRRRRAAGRQLRRRCREAAGRVVRSRPGPDPQDHRLERGEQLHRLRHRRLADLRARRLRVHRLQHRHQRHQPTAATRHGRHRDRAGQSDDAATYTAKADAIKPRSTTACGTPPSRHLPRRPAER